MHLARTLYRLTEGFPKSEMFGLTSRAAVSVPSNIAEGRGRRTDKSFASFLSQAQGSLYELQTQIELARDLGFADRDPAEEVLRETGEIAAMIHGLLAKLDLAD